MASINDLELMTYNPTSLIKRERRKVVDELIKKEQIDIVLLQETRQRECHGLFFSKMKIYKSSEGVGTAIGIKDKYKSQRVFIKDMKLLNYTAITIYSRNKRVLVVSLYIDHKIKKEELEEELKALSAEAEKYDDVIIGGDLNSRNIAWNEANDTVTCMRGRTIKDWIDNHLDLELISPLGNTFRGESKLDHFIMSQRMALEVKETKICQDATCHSAFKATINMGRNSLEKTKREKTFKFKDVDWEELRTTVTHKLVAIPVRKNKNYAEEEIDQLITEISGAVREAMDEKIKKVQIKMAKTCDLPDEVVNLIKIRRGAVKEKCRANHNPALKNLLQGVIKDLTKEIDSKIKAAEAEELETKLKTINVDHNAFKNLKRFTGGNALTCEKAELSVNGKQLGDSKAKADYIADYYEEVYKGVTPDNDRLNEVLAKYQEVRNYTNSITFDDGKDALNNHDEEDPERKSLTNVQELIGISKGLNNKKSAGEDGISNYILRKLPALFWNYTTIIFNNCFRLNYFPKPWKRGIIVPIPKVTKAESPKDLRPISMLSNWGKLLEEIILIRMKNEEGLIEGVPNHQFGFKTRHSAVNAVESLNAEANEARRTGKMVGVCSLDISKAFDCVWKEGLIFKTSAMDLDKNIVGLIGSFMNDRCAKVKVGDKHSEEFLIERGVPQGSKLGPSLYNIYTSDIKIKNTEHRGMKQFADDTLVWTAQRNPEIVKMTIEADVENLMNQMKNWGIAANKSKTKFLAIKSKGTKNIKNMIKLREGIEIDGEEIKCDSTLKYLGLHLNEDNDSKTTTDHAIKKGHTAFKKVGWLLKKKGMKKSVKSLFYKQLIRPAMTYGIGAWPNMKQRDVEKLELCERKMLRRITGCWRRDDGRTYSNKQLYEEAEIKESIGQLIERLHINYENSKLEHPNKEFTSRLETLKKREIDHRVRNLEYEEQKRIWKDMKNTNIEPTVSNERIIDITQ